MTTTDLNVGDIERLPDALRVAPAPSLVADATEAPGRPAAVAGLVAAPLDILRAGVGGLLNGGLPYVVHGYVSTSLVATPPILEFFSPRLIDEAILLARAPLPAAGGSAQAELLDGLFALYADRPPAAGPVATATPQTAERALLHARTLRRIGQETELLDRLFGAADQATLLGRRPADPTSLVQALFAASESGADNALSVVVALLAGGAAIVYAQELVSELQYSHEFRRKPGCPALRQ
jgi:hypothetical protein